MSLRNSSKPRESSSYSLEVSVEYFVWQFCEVKIKGRRMFALTGSSPSEMDAPRIAIPGPVKHQE